MRWVRPAVASARLLLRPRPGAAPALVHRPASLVTSSSMVRDPPSFRLPNRSLSSAGATVGDHQVDKQTLEQMLADKGVVLIDVRMPKEVDEFGLIPSSVNIPFDKLQKAFSLSADEFLAKYGIEKPASPGTNVVLYCMRGGRSPNAIPELHGMGFNRVRYLSGGFKEWIKKK